MQSLALWLYSAAVWLAQPLLRRKLRRRAQAEPGYAHAVDERFGHYTGDPPELESRRFVWIHAVSLGETRAAAVLLHALRRQSPGMRLLLTHGTATGRAEGQKLLQPGDVQVWQPWDTRGAVQRFLRQFQPLVGILIETEVWPNLVAGCRAHSVPLVLANARLSEKSLASALRLAALSRPTYAALSAVYAQTQADAERLRTLGAPVQAVLGNLKFDAQPKLAQLEQGRAYRKALARPVLLCASSREGEEAEWLKNFKQKRALALASQAQAAINTVANNVLWVIVPRHPQRFDAVCQLLVSAGLRVARRSQTDAPPSDIDVWLGDTLGDMALYYSLADVALLGGSFAPLGGQNLIEAAACGCPVVLGPHVFNFAEAAEQACAAGAADQVADMDAALDFAMALAGDSRRLCAARQSAAQFAQAHTGAAERTASALAQWLNND